MKLVTFLMDNAQRVGVLTSDGASVVDVQAAARHFGDEEPAFFDSTIRMLEAGQEAVDLASDLARESEADDRSKTIVPLNQVSLLSPVPRPRSIRDCLAFE